MITKERYPDLYDLCVFHRIDPKTEIRDFPKFINPILCSMGINKIKCTEIINTSLCRLEGELRRSFSS